ncbi:hypothetical protein QFC19_004828 [Naganishia cerealis]|uniref:Uncharacterized protein n=1 Tax=Naganishia cerealis TaxID=610337 RepID=A0ACC2VS70_9TREE|nr:hypothetical protein QFC19_004828 [Naganishia cerealis]
MQTILELTPRGSRRNSISSDRSHDSKFSSSSVDLHHGKTSGASTSEAPFGSTGKPHTLSEIAHRAIGEYAPDHAHHSTTGSKYNKRALPEDRQDSTVVGGEHPGLERSAGSGRVSKGMPNTPWTNVKAEELRKDRDGESEESSPEEKNAKKLAGDKMRHVMGVASDAGMDTEHIDEDHEKRETKEDRDEKATRDAVEKLTIHADLHNRDLNNRRSGEPTSHDNEEVYTSQARKDQEKYLHMDKTTARQGNPEFVADQASDNRDDSRQRSVSHSPDGRASAEPKTNGHAICGSRNQEDSEHEESSEPRDGDAKDIERLPNRNPKENANGEVPDGMFPTKKETAPGPQNEINLRPRIPVMQFHTAEGFIDIHNKAHRVPLRVAADGETEDLPNGKPFRYAPDPEDNMTSTRDKEREFLGIAGQKDKENDGDYGDERLINGEHVGPSSKGGLVMGEIDAHNDEDEEDDIVPDLNDKGKGKKVGTHQIPRATHRPPDVVQDELVSANASPMSVRPAKAGRLWSTFRQKSADEHDGEQRKNSRPRQPGTDGLAGAMDNDRIVEEPESTGQKKWAVLRQKLLHRQTNGPIPHANPAIIPVTSELLAGQLPVMILKTWLDRDESGHRAVPVLLGNLRFRIGDSAGMSAGQEEHSGREVFRIECEYGDGAVKWVIYRELRDFFVLHTNYKTGNLGNKLSHLTGARRVEIPEFPRNCIPYLGKLRRWEGKAVGIDEEQPAEQHRGVMEKHKHMSKEEISKEVRASLQRYLVDLIRAVMFRPESNRLCRFFELSALTISLAPRGGFQSKAGFLKIKGSNASARRNQPGLTPTSWAASRKPRWWIVRDSYFVATDGPESTEIYDVFMIDSDFAIERPKRVLRKTLKALTGQGSLKVLARIEKEEGKGGSGTAEADRQAKIAAAAGSGAPLPDESEGSSESSSEDGGDRTAIANKPKQKLKKSKGAALNENEPGSASQHTFYIISAQRRVKVAASNIRLMQQFIIAMERVAAHSVWTGKNRFDSFAPIRMNVAAQWLVDGRDYFWSLSRAINMAKETVYIHDWWISPELYLRRPGDERYRLDNLLKRKAEEGVKIFIIIYNEVSDKTTPTDSLYTKQRLVGLHPNIMVQRSPSHFQTGTFFWSHHEKMCVIDEAIAFMGGLDLCFGRWDTSQHVLIDEDFEPGATGENGPIWPGKDMANERVVEYHTLNKPFEDMFDRTKVPRMPWHDVGLQIVGQPARDLCRHFIQRWNHLIRIKNHSRPMPFLLPPSDFTELELKSLGLAGTCEIQICRSCGPWSMGTATKVEHSIQNAYLKAIQLSDHFVYIENQFFITSTVVDGVEIENRIGDALVDRIIRAHKDGTPWRACIVIPLLPGYPAPLDTAEASSVRLILECQNRTISRGTQSIFSRLRKQGIDPDDYITFFSLRGWSKFKSGALTTEQVYIHGKTMVVDDRLVICGSANINERSQRGDRDSELAAIIRDTDMIESTMAGQPYMVGRFAHTLRMRLMREHVGIDVDALEEDQLISRKPIGSEDEIQKWDPDHEQNEGERTTAGVTQVKAVKARTRFMATVENGVSSLTKGLSENAISNIKKSANVVIKPASIVKQKNTIIGAGATGDISERQDYDRKGIIAQGFASSIVPTLEEKTIFERRPSARHANGKPLFDVLVRITFVVLIICLPVQAIVRLSGNIG